MTPSFLALPPTASLAAHFAGGLALGLLHFGSLWRTTRLFAAGGRAATALALMLARIVVLGGVMTLVSFEGAPPLLAMALGVLLARPIVGRRIGRAIR